jgi:hypothetical protein
MFNCTDSKGKPSLLGKPPANLYIPGARNRYLIGEGARNLLTLDKNDPKFMTQSLFVKLTKLIGYNNTVPALNAFKLQVVGVENSNA